MYKKFIASVALVFASTLASAALIVPVYDTFGALPGATFGGSGIPAHAVAIAQSPGDLTLGLTAHQRLVGPNLANDNAGTFTAFSGSPGGGLSTWNFAFYIAGSDISDLGFVLEYDFDPATGNDASTHGTVAFAGVGLGSLIEDSQNLGFAYLATGGVFGPATVTPPGSPTSFDPNALGEYTFRLTAYAFTGQGLTPQAQVAIRVNVVEGQDVPEPSTLLLLALPLLGVSLVQRRKR